MSPLRMFTARESDALSEVRYQGLQTAVGWHDAGACAAVQQVVYSTGGPMRHLPQCNRVSPKQV